MQRSPFVVLGVSRTADADEVRSAYKKLALKWHPDKNLDNVDEATEKFKEIQASFAVLNDPVLRASLDDEGNLPSDEGPRQASDAAVGLVNLTPLFNPSCFTDFSDKPGAFYAVYSDVFAKIDAEEIRLREFDLERSKSAAPSFGTSTSADDDVKLFYAYWESFSSKMTFEWTDEYDPAEAPNRAIRRAIEKENKKKRDASRKKRSEHVRSLVSFVKGMDKRAMRISMQARAIAEAKARAQQEMKEKRERDKIEARRKRKEYIESMLAAEVEPDTPEEGFYRADEDDEFFAAGKGRRDESEDEEVVWRCEACSKTFKSEKQLNNHEKSKKHVETVARLREQFLEEDAAAGSGEEFAPEASEPSADEAAASIVEDTVEPEESVSSDSEVEPTGSVPPTEPAACDASCDEPTESHPAAINEPKLTAKQKREARRAKKAVKAEKTAASEKREEDDDGAVKCAVCDETFSSRNKLFQHVKKTGHAVPLAQKAVPVGAKPVKPNSRANRRGKRGEED